MPKTNNAYLLMVFFHILIMGKLLHLANRTLIILKKEYSITEGNVNALTE